MIKRRKSSLSVVVCTRDRYQQAKDCLSNLLQQQDGHLEIITIDNSDAKEASRERRGFANFCRKNKIHLIPGKKKGLSAGRNLGIRRSKGEIVAFTDDDCIADGNWIKEIRKGLTSHPCLTGRTISQDSGLSDLGERRKLFSYGPLSYWTWRIGHGSNLAFRREVFEKVGLFDEEFGVGARHQAAEDADFLLRCLKKGLKIVFWPEAIVFHAQKSRESLLKSAFSYQYGYKKLLLKHKDPYALLHLGIFPPLAAARFLGSLITRPSETKIRLAKLKGFLA
jgi:GT2 family glycosyltransferase